MNRYPVSPAAFRWSWTEARLLLGVAMGFAAFAFIGCGSSSSNTNPDIPNPTHVASLTQAQETPPTNSTATGTAKFALSGTTLTYSVTHNVANPNAAHLHTAPAGTSGPVTVPLNVAAANFGGTVTLTQQQVTDFDGGLMYINIHNAANPNGDIRGQVLHPGEVLYTAIMTGAKERPTPNNSTATGAIGFILNASGNQLTYNGSFSGLTGNATAAHVHIGGANQAGNIVYPLSFTPPTGSPSGTFAGQQNVTAADVSNINNNNWYAQVHSAGFTGGEIRDQLTKQ